MTPDWTATALFSPSKARVQQAQAKDWAAVDAWLAKQYAPLKRPPTFERNEETLQALLDLATLNERADEQRALVDRVHKAALQSLSKADSHSGTDDLMALFKHLNVDVALTSLAEAAVALDVPDVRIGTLASAIADLTSQHFVAEQMLQRAEDQLRAIRAQRRKADEQLKQLQSDSFRAPANLVEQTAEWMRSAKQLKAKIAEYDERLASARAAGAPKVKLEDISRQAEELSAQQARLRELQAHLQVFQDLPADARAARRVLETARDDLRAVTKKRDALFGGLVDDG